MKRDIENHVTGISKFVDDYPTLEGTLEGYVFYSEKAHAKILNIDYSEALKSEGVFAILTSKDIPGQNQIGGIIQDEKLFADDKVEFIGEPIALIVAESKESAKKAAKKTTIEYGTTTGERNRKEIASVTKAFITFFLKSFFMISETAT